MTSSSPTVPARAGRQSRAGLRERKKARTRAAIRDAAMRLFGEQGYAATTVDQIADAAEVSQSTFFRYFPTKEDVVLTDDYDPAVFDVLLAQPPEVHPIDAVIAAVHEIFGAMSDEDRAAESRRQHLLHTVPELRGRALQQSAAAVRLLGEAFARRAGRPADDFPSHVMAGAVAGAALVAMPIGRPDGFTGHDLDRMTEALRLLRNGF